MNNNHVHHSDHHSNEIRENPSLSEHAHLNTNDYHSMMQMYLHTGFTETVLFKPWSITTVEFFMCSWILIFILGILNEGIKELRQYLEEERHIKKPIVSDDGTETELERMNSELPEPTREGKKRIPPPYGERALYGVSYAIHSALSYILMLIVMTLNIYLIMAIIFGAGVGHLLFIWTRIIPSASRRQRRT